MPNSMGDFPKGPGGAYCELTVADLVTSTLAGLKPLGSKQWQKWSLYPPLQSGSQPSEIDSGR